MSLFNRRDVHQQKEGFVSRLLNRKGKSAKEEEEDRRPSLRTTYRQRQSENLWGATRRSSCSSKIFRDMQKIHRRMSGSSRKIMHSSKELFASLGRSDGSLDPDELATVDDDTGMGGNGDKGDRRWRSTSKKTNLAKDKKKSAQDDTCDDSDLNKSMVPDDGFYGWPSSQETIIY